MILLSLDPGRVVGWALFDFEILFRFGQFPIHSAKGLQAEIAAVLKGEAGYPLPPPGRRFPMRPGLAILEEGSVRYHVNHRGAVGEHKIYRDMMKNTEYRRVLAAVLLKEGVPSLGVSPEEWGSAENVGLRARAELERGHIDVPSNFDLPAREHERDAVVIGGWCARRKVWRADAGGVF